jgi:hypothetical protein
VITVFHKQHLAYVVSELESWIPFLRGKILPIFDKERARLHRTGAALNEPAQVIVAGEEGRGGEEERGGRREREEYVFVKFAIFGF